MNTSKDASEWVEVADVPKLNLPDIEEVHCAYHKSDPNYYFIKCKPKKRFMGGCLVCGSINYEVHGKRDRQVHDSSIGLKRIGLILKTPRYLCKDCGATFTHPYESIRDNQQFTNRLYQQIKERAINEPFSGIAAEYGISNTTVADIVKEYGKELETQRVLVAPRVLGIDEKHIVHSARGVFVDIENGKLIEMTADNKRETMKSTIERMIDNDKIEIVTMDMSSGYCNLVQDCLPNAMIVIDRFHVERYTYKAMENTRRAIFKRLKEQVSMLPDGNEKADKEKLLTDLGKHIYLFRYKISTIKSSLDKANLLAKICNTFPEFQTLLTVKIAAERIYTARDRDTALQYVNDLAKNVPNNSDYDLFTNFLRMFSRWSEFILNWFDDKCVYANPSPSDEKRYSNGTTEGVNSFIGRLNGIGSGYSFDVLRYKCLFYKGAAEKPVTKLRQSVVKSYNSAFSSKKMTSFSNGKLPYLQPNTEVITEEYYESGDRTDIWRLLHDINEHKIF